MFSLRFAVEAADKIWKAQNKHAAHIDSVVQTIGYTKRTGASLRAISALDQYGLTKETGNSDNRNVGLSEAALDILMGTAEQKQKALKSAAIKPTIYRELWSRYGAHPPADDVMRTFLIREKSFNPTVVDDVVKDYRITVEYANLRDNIPEDEPPSDSAPSEDAPLPSTSSKPLQRKPSAPMTANVRYLPIPLDIGDAPIPVGMSDSDFNLLLDTLKLWKKKIVLSEIPAEPEE
ncbi:hypothetical protein BH18VER1_BH18VER1_07860 [soil metagenome]